MPDANFDTENFIKKLKSEIADLNKTKENQGKVIQKLEQEKAGFDIMSHSRFRFVLLSFYLKLLKTNNMFFHSQSISHKQIIN